MESTFGAEFTLSDGILVRTHIEDFDPDGKLVNVPYQGKNYTITRKGAR